MQATEPSTGASGGESGGGFGYFDNLWNWLSGIVDWLKSIAEGVVQIPISIWDNVKNIPAMVWDFVKEIPGQVWEFVKQIPGQVWSFFESAFSSLGDVVSNIWNAVKGIPDAIFEGIKRIFIPDTDKIQSSIDKLKDAAKSKFGVESVDLSGIMGVGTEVTNHSGTVEILGYSFTADFLDVSYLISGVTTFRPYIRGFIILLIFLYNINQFLHFIGAGGLSLGANIVTRIGGGNKNDN